MPFRCALGMGKHDDSATAGREAVLNCRMQLGDTVPDLLLLFCSTTYEAADVLAAVAEGFPAAPLLGCSTAGEISSLGPEENSVQLVAFHGLNVRLAQGGMLKANPLAAGELLGRRLATPKGKILLVLSDGMTGDGGAVVQGIQQGLGHIIPLTGGAAGDGGQFRSTFQYLNDRVLSGTVVGACLSGDFHLGVGKRHGWEPVGLPVMVTKARGNRLLEVNRISAFEFYNDYFGEYAERLRTAPLARLAVSYPLGLAVPNAKEYLLRAPMEVEADGAIKFTAEIPEGAKVRLMIGSVEGAIQAARLAAQEALAQMQGRLPKIALLFNCFARRRLLGLRAQDEIAAIKKVLGQDVPLAGFYTYGEIASQPNTPADSSSFHNETVVILLMG